MFKIPSITLVAVLTLGASRKLRPRRKCRQTPASNATYRINVVSRTTRAVSYKHRSGATKINFQGTDLMPAAAGEAKVESKRGTLAAKPNFLDWTSHEFWQRVSPPMSCGRFRRRPPSQYRRSFGGDNHRTKLDVTTDLQAFAMIVTAEPYYAVRRPSNVVVLENAIRSDTVGASEAVDAKYELIDRGGYIPTGYKFDPVILNAKLPLEFF